MKQAKFITLVSDSLGVEEKTVKVVVRVLREAGLFTTGARGVNAPENTSLDAARVVLALTASPSPSRAAQDVSYFGALKADIREELHDATYELEIDRNHTLEELLVHCIDGRRLGQHEATAVLKLSDDGSAVIKGEFFYEQEFVQRDQWESFQKNKDGLDSGEMARLWLSSPEAKERLNRVLSTVINRSGEIPFQAIRTIANAFLEDEAAK
jgi:hypothetical protein